MTYRGPAFDTPPAPPGWDGSGLELIRIVDPRGGAIAWLAPDLGASCIGYAVHMWPERLEPWQYIIRSASPAALIASPDHHGCTVRWPFPEPPPALDHWRWQFIERDPTAAIFRTTVQPHAQLDARARLEMLLTARLNHEALSLHLHMRNVGDTSTPIRAGIRLPPKAQVVVTGGSQEAMARPLSPGASRHFTVTVRPSLAISPHIVP